MIVAPRCGSGGHKETLIMTDVGGSTMTACNYITDMKDKGERKTSSKSHSVVTLEDLNITKNKSSQWQRLVA